MQPNGLKREIFQFAQVMKQSNRLLRIETSKIAGERPALSMGTKRNASK